MFSFSILRTGFRRGEEGSRKLTGQLVRRYQFGEVLQVADRFRKLCRDALSLLSVLRTGFRRGEEDSWKLTGQFVDPEFQGRQARQISNRFRELCHFRVFSFSILRTALLHAFQSALEF